MRTPLLLVIYCILIFFGSLAGGFLPWLVKLTHRRMQVVMSSVGGFMLGVALLHLLPHSIAEQGSVDMAMGWALIGLLTMFLLIRVFHVHAHEHGEGVTDEHAHDHGHHAEHDHAGPCAHGHPHEHHEALKAGNAYSWVGLALGLALHTIIDGLALGAAVAAEAAHEGNFMFYGLGTFLAILLHKPLDSLSITSLMRSGGWSQRATVLANVAFALMCPLGAIGFVFGLDAISADQHLVVGCALAFAAGVFLCISLADLLPEVTFHSHDRGWFTAALFIGVAASALIGMLEPKHAHSHGHGVPVEAEVTEKP